MDDDVNECIRFNNWVGDGLVSSLVVDWRGGRRPVRASGCSPDRWYRIGHGVTGCEQMLARIYGICQYPRSRNSLRTLQLTER